MNGETTLSISLIIAIVGCAVGLGGFMRGRDSKIITDAEWKGSVNAKLDAIIGIRKDVDDLSKDVVDLGKKVAVVETSVKSAHHRLDGAGIARAKDD